jgi:hypothetical protein
MHSSPRKANRTAISTHATSHQDNSTGIQSKTFSGFMCYILCWQIQQFSTLSEIRDMNTARRSYLFRIAILCLTVLLSQTANATSLSHLLVPGTPCSYLKLTSARPEPRKTLRLNAKKVRDSRPAWRNDAGLSTSYFVPASLAQACAAGEPRTSFILQTSRTLEIAPQSRSFVLRI